MIRLATLLVATVALAGCAPQANDQPSANASSTNAAATGEFEKLAKETGAKVVIQHEPADISKLPGVAGAAG
ncbi:hypothetical protein [Sphingomonas sp.]|uniref:hypothetical protein n=1 Tax=Sphingomonas sp. TaxID=28214 RepID=UPI0017AEB39C|nr:hypothetical protein [Sphingomonas sp.]MBA3512192.1 hypothetical protein [Sphingomonas sp.]